MAPGEAANHSFWRTRNGLILAAAMLSSAVAGPQGRRIADPHQRLDEPAASRFGLADVRGDGLARREEPALRFAWRLDDPDLRAHLVLRLLPDRVARV